MPRRSLSWFWSGMRPCSHEVDNGAPNRRDASYSPNFTECRGTTGVSPQGAPIGLHRARSGVRMKPRLPRRGRSPGPPRGPPRVYYDRRMLRPASWTRPAGVSPVWVGTGAPSSRPRFVGEIWRAERGVESLFGGSKITGRSVKRTLQPRQTHNGRAEPLMSRRRPCPSGPVPGSAWRVFPGYGWRHVVTVWFGTGETRLPGLCRAKTAGISQW